METLVESASDHGSSKSDRVNTASRLYVLGRTTVFPGGYYFSEETWNLK